MDPRTIIIAIIAIALVIRMGALTWLMSMLQGFKMPQLSSTPVPSQVIVAPPVQPVYDGTTVSVVREWEEFRKAAEAAGAKEAVKAMDDVFPLIIKKG